MTLLDVRHCLKLQSCEILRKTNEPHLRKQQKTDFQPDFGLFWPILVPQFFFSWALPLLEVLHCYKLSLYVISRKTKLEKMAKNLVWSLILAPLAQFGPPNFFLGGGWILVLLDNRHYCKLSLYAISWKTKEPNLRKGQKNMFWA